MMLFHLNIDADSDENHDAIHDELIKIGTAQQVHAIFDDTENPRAGQRAADGPVAAAGDDRDLLAEFYAFPLDRLIGGARTNCRRAAWWPLRAQMRVRFSRGPRGKRGAPGDRSSRTRL